MEIKERKVTTFVTGSGRAPYEEWFETLKDKRAQALVLSRIDRVCLGNFGNCKSVGNGVYELRIYYSSGLRIYFGLEGEQVVILLCGGDKGSQRKDIAYAQELWMEYKKDANKKL
ncbi:MAG: type II toxin-antitoxin system RelE/ParE family toxin [Deltaproteobacteria bacterium]|nr:type II toxin-antitoxin system RelE/ParE family toxin [Deltaproteobacteria bacterium]